jgi:hypothetical protein
MACNSTTGKHANEGLNIIAPILTGILSQGGSIGFLAMSFYGSDAGNAVGSDTPCPRFSGCGYDPRQAAVAAEGLAFLRGLAPALRRVPLQVQEYAPMINGYGRGPTFEPGAYGGAWMLASSVQFAAQGIDRVFHWGIDEAFGSDGHHLYYANAWVMAAARKLFGASSAANISVLVTPGGDAAGRQTPAVAVAHPHPHPQVEKDEGQEVATCGSTTTASGVGGMLAARAAAGGNAAQGIGLLVSLFNQRKDCTNETTVSVTFQCPTPSACESEGGSRGEGEGGGVAEDGSAPRVRLMRLNHTTSVYGQILRHAGQHEGWLNHQDGEIYPLGGQQADAMLTLTGLAVRNTPFSFAILC